MPRTIDDSDQVQSDIDAAVDVAVFLTDGYLVLDPHHLGFEDDRHTLTHCEAQLIAFALHRLYGLDARDVLATKPAGEAVTEVRTRNSDLSFYAYRQDDCVVWLLAAPGKTLDDFTA